MTPNKEDYLKCIYEIGTETSKITNKEIAQRMQVSPPAVTEMMKKLLVEGLLIKDKSRGYVMTEAGMQVTSDLYRKHRLIEVFLVNHLGYATDQIHEEAEVLEHTVSDQFVERLDKLLDFPTVCPHGGTIPKPGQLLVEDFQQTLQGTGEMGAYTVVRVQDDYQLLTFLEQHHIGVGTELELIHFDPFTQTYQVQMADKELSLGPTVTPHIYVEKK